MFKFYNNYNYHTGYKNVIYNTNHQNWSAIPGDMTPIRNCANGARVAYIAKRNRVYACGNFYDYPACVNDNPCIWISADFPNDGWHRIKTPGSHEVRVDIFNAEITMHKVYSTHT